MDKIKQLIGKRIKELRQRKGFSQQKLAELVDIDQRSLSYIECGGVFPSKSLFRLAEALGVDVGDIFEFSHLTLTEEDMKNYIKKSLDEISFENVKILYRFLKAMK